jgi:hypothetical protein
MYISRWPIMSLVECGSIFGMALQQQQTKKLRTWFYKDDKLLLS